MTYSEVLTELYSDELSRIINILNKSIYALSIDKEEEDIFVVHTGFVFKTHKKTPIEILYDFNFERIIRQPRKENFSSNIPLINGLLVKGEGQYFGSFYPYILFDIDYKNNGKFRYVEICNPRQYFQKSNIAEIEVKGFDGEFLKSINIIGGKEILVFPFQKRFSEEIFCEGNHFSKNLSRDECSNSRDYQIKNDHPNYEHWLRQEYGDDADTAFWNNE